jgi:predicted RND superfamily exporter protein
MAGAGRGIGGRLAAIDHQRAIDWLDDRIVNDSRRVVLVFLLLTGVFALGLGNVSTEAGTQQFTTGLPSEEALTRINQEFSPAFEPDSGSTTIIQRGDNVLSKEGLRRMLVVQERATDRPALRVTSTSSAASLVAQQLDPSAQTPAAQRRVVERATSTEIDRAVRTLADRSDRFAGLLSRDFNVADASASATIGTLAHEVPAGLTSGAGQGGSSPLTPIQLHVDFLAEDVGGMTIFGSGILADEFSSVIVDSLLIVVPAAVLFILFFLMVAYRDLADLGLGLLTLIMAIVWTFGFMGLAGIPFSQMLIAVPPLLLAVGIDFGIHIVNRYREEHTLGTGSDAAMRITTDQLLVAFFIVTGTTVIGFAANFSSALAPIRDFGLVASIGIVFTFLLFGIFLPAAKVWLDDARRRYPIPTFSRRPLGSEDSVLGRVLGAGVVVARHAPGLFLVVVLLAAGGAGVYATGVDTSFGQEDFLPPEDNPDFLEALPEPFAPSDYTVAGTLDFLEDNFEATQQDSATIYWETGMTRDSALAEIQRAGRDPPSAILSDGRQADAQSIVSVIRSRAASDPEFRRLVNRHDADGDGVPDRNLREVYDYLLDSSSRSTALSYLAEDYRSTRVVYSLSADASQAEIDRDARAVADRYRGDATATGQTIVFQAVSDLILESALTSLVIALVGASIYLVIIYQVFEGSWSLGLANVVPIFVTVAAVAGSMRYFGVPFNALTATILAVTIGLGIDYSVHVTHRFADERERRDLLPALDRTVRGTGGALLGSMLTTVSGIGVLALAVFPAIGQFGILTGLSVFYAFLASVVVLPAVLVVWDGLVDDDVPLRALIAPALADGRPFTAPAPEESVGRP